MAWLWGYISLCDACQTARRRSHLDCLVIDRIDTVDAKPEPNQDEHRLRPLALGRPRRRLDFTFVHGSIDNTTDAHSSRFKVVHERLDRACGGGGPEPLADVLAELLAHEREPVHGERSE